MRKILLGLLILSVFGNLYLLQKSRKEIPAKQIAKNLDEREQYQYLASRIFGLNNNDIIVNFVPLRSKLRAYIEPLKVPVGTYFEYLPSGVSIGINEKLNFIPASLLKVPLVMATYKQIEKGNLSLDTQLTITSSDLDDKFGNLYQKGAGTKITVGQAIRETLINSDNTARNVLISTLPMGPVEDVFDYLDIPKDLEDNTAMVTAKNYSSILRSLYLSSYLEKQDSNAILDLLTQTPFNDQLASTLPKETKVAHKIGVYTQNPKNQTYTDCGIIYYPNRPYILCLMVQSSFTDAQTHMGEISKIVYEYVSSVNK